MPRRKKLKPQSRPNNKAPEPTATIAPAKNLGFNFSWRLWGFLTFAVVLVGSACWWTFSSQPNAPGDANQEQRETASDQLNLTGGQLPSVPAAGPAQLIAPLADAYARIDPTRDGWQSEALSEQINKQLKRIAKICTQKPLSSEKLKQVLAEGFQCGRLQPAALQTRFDRDALLVQRANRPDQLRGAKQETLGGAEELADALKTILSSITGTPYVKFKLFRVEPFEPRKTSQPSHRTEAFFHLSGTTEEGQLEINATWECLWNLEDDPPRLRNLRVHDFERVVGRNPSPAAQGRKQFADCTESLLAELPCWQDQLVYGVDHWRARLVRTLGLTVTGNHGLAVGDVNGDDLDDLYLCFEAGLPNRLLMQQPDGTLRDRSAESGVDWLDPTAAALLVDLDNDGDQDLVVAHAWQLALMSNDGQGRFTLQQSLETTGQTFSMASADFDSDGDLDLYLCAYHTTPEVRRGGAMATPIPFHDANNGAANMLLRQDGPWQFHNVVAEVGLDENNTRFSYAASWEDYDNDGDLDLYVANDFGRNNLYRNDQGRFRDVAAEVGVEDMAAGMSVSFADYNLDGWMDVYVSNMFSGAGNRITYQRQFKTSSDDLVKDQFRRHARGNSLFANREGKRFEDVSQQAEVTMGRWAWGSQFADLNNDGLEDLLVANGFITASDPDDL